MKFVVGYSARIPAIGVILPIDWHYSHQPAVMDVHKVEPANREGHLGIKGTLRVESTDFSCGNGKTNPQVLGEIANISFRQENLFSPYANHFGSRIKACKVIRRGKRAGRWLSDQGSFPP
jgi:hypothetical protein